MIITNLSYYKNMLMSGAIFFSVQTRLSSPEIVVYPHPSELFKLMTKVVRDIIEG